MKLSLGPRLIDEVAAILLESLQRDLEREEAERRAKKATAKGKKAA